MVTHKGAVSTHCMGKRSLAKCLSVYTNTYKTDKIVYIVKANDWVMLSFKPSNIAVIPTSQ